MAMNPWEIVGSGLRQVSQDVGQFGDRQRQYQEMVQRRVQAMEDQKRIEEDDKRRQEEADRQQKEFEQKQAQLQLEQQEKDRAAKALEATQKYALGTPEKPAQPYMEPGRGPNNEAMSAPVPAFKPSRDEIMSHGMQGGAYQNEGFRAWVDDTKPEKPVQARFSIQEIGNRKVRVNIDTGEQEDLGAASQSTARDRYSIQEIGGRKVRLNMDTGEQLDIGPATPKTNVKSDAQVKYDALPPEKQKQIDILSTALGKRQNTINELETALAEFTAAKSDRDRERIGGGMLKTLNSPENPDAIGAEEERRIGNALVFQKGNFMGQGQVFGRDFPGFETQVKAKVAAMKASKVKNQSNIDSLYGEPQDPKAAKRAAWDAKNGPKEGQTKVNSNGRTVIFTNGAWRAK